VLTRGVCGRDRADGVRFELATPADDAEVRRLLRENPMPGRVSISLEREPDAGLAAEVESDVHHTVVARDPATGCFANSTRRWGRRST